MIGLEKQVNLYKNGAKGKKLVVNDKDFVIPNYNFWKVSILC